MKKVFSVLIKKNSRPFCAVSLSPFILWWYKEEIRNGNSGTEGQAQNRMRGKYRYFLITEEVYYRKTAWKISVDLYLRLRKFLAYVHFNSTICELICIIRRMELHFMKILKPGCVSDSIFTVKQLCLLHCDFLLDLNHFWRKEKQSILQFKDFCHQTDIPRKPYVNIINF